MRIQWKKLLLAIAIPEVVGGLSALLTTTMPAMRSTVEKINAASWRGNVKVMVGGAVVTPEYAAGLGARYARDAQDSARIARSVLG